MPNIDNLNLQNDEIIGEINWDAPERGTFTPRLKAGKDYEFLFELEPDDSFTEREWDGKSVKGIRYKATTSYTTPDHEEKEVTIRFQSADFFKTEKMAAKRVNSDGEELMRSLDIHIDGPMTWDKVKQAFREVDGRRKFNATVGYVAYSKEDKLYIRTHPRKNDLPWPRGADGRPEAVVTFPSGERASGREEIVRLRLPKKN